MTQVNSAKTTESVSLETIRYTQPSQDPSEALIEVESSCNRQSDPIEEFNGESYQHYWSIKTFEALKSDGTFDTKCKDPLGGACLRATFFPFPQSHNESIRSPDRGAFGSQNFDNNCY